MPRARPETTVSPTRASDAASRSAIRSPYGVQCREPTIAMASGSRGSNVAPDVEQAGRVGDLGEHRRDSRPIAPRDRPGRPCSPAQRQLGLGVELAPGPRDPLGQLGADAGDVLQPLHRRVEHAAGRSEVLEQGPAGLRADARDHRQADQVAELVVGHDSARDSACAEVVASASRTTGLGSGCVGQLDVAEPPRQDEPDPPAPVLLVAAHGVDQGVGIEAGGRGRQAEPLEQGDEPRRHARRRSSPSRSAIRASATMPTATASPCWNAPP